MYNDPNMIDRGETSILEFRRNVNVGLTVYVGPAVKDTLCIRRKFTFGTMARMSVLELRRHVTFGSSAKRRCWYYGERLLVGEDYCFSRGLLAYLISYDQNWPETD